MKRSSARTGRSTVRSLARITGIVVGSVALLVAILAGAAYVLSDRKQYRLVDVPVAAIDFGAYTDPAGRGRYLYETRGCRECHGESGAGRVIVDDKKHGLYVRSPNITSGAGGAAKTYTDTDWVRLLRHGIKPSHEPAFVMPAEDSALLSDEDVAALAAYVRTLPPQNGERAEFRIPLMLRAMYVVGAFKDAAEKIDHSKPVARSVAVEATASYGKYVAATCTGCHGSGLAGGRIPGAPPSWPAAANLTPAPDSAMSRYPSVVEFRDMMRTGRRPDGSAISTVMPFSSLAKMSDVEVEAVFLFLKSLKPRP